MFIYKKKGIPEVSKGGCKQYEQDGISFEENIYGGVWYRMITMLKKGATKKAHKHNFDHVHFVVAGSVSVIMLEEGEGKKITRTPLGEFKAPQTIAVPAGIAHEVTALEDNTVALCVQPVRDEDGIVMCTENTDGSTDVETTML